jgi:hypothetical protein
MCEPERRSQMERCKKCEPPDGGEDRTWCDGRCVDDWKLTRAAIEQENALINQRVNWLPLAQALFFAAFVYFATEARPLLLDLLGPKPDGLGRLLRDPLWPQDGRMELYGLIGLVLIALFGVLYSFIILVSVGAAVQHIRHLENWWCRRYNPCEYNPSEEAPEDTLWNHTAWWNPIPSKGTIKRLWNRLRSPNQGPSKHNIKKQIKARECIPCPPINGKLVGEGYRIFHAPAVPFTFFCFWVDSVVVALLMMVPYFCPWARKPWYLLPLCIIVLVISVVFFKGWERYQLLFGGRARQVIGGQDKLLMRCRISTDQKKV